MVGGVMVSLVAFQAVDRSSVLDRGNLKKNYILKKLIFIGRKVSLTCGGRTGRPRKVHRLDLIFINLQFYFEVVGILHSRSSKQEKDYCLHEILMPVYV